MPARTPPRVPEGSSKDLISQPPAKSSFTDALTPRETEIARLAACGLTNKEIAQTLDISHWTVATHMRRIFDKTSVHRRAALGQALQTG